MKNVNKKIYGKELNIRLRVLTTSNNSNIDSITLKLKLKREADITIYGKSEDQSFPFGNITHGVFVGQPIMCKSNFSYILESKTTEITEKLESDGTSDLLRRRRQVEVFQSITPNKKEEIKIDNKEFEIVPNRTFFLNCSMKEVLCSSIFCSIGPFEKRQPPALIQIKMMLDTSVIHGMLGTKDIVLYSTYGSVMIERPPKFIQNGNRPDFAEVSSLFINEIAKKKRAGFFKRAKKEELKNLKAAANKLQEENEIPDLNDDAFEPAVNASCEGLVEECEEK
ncbi:hypothetical protein NQ314_012862 [Rhamnusium bicolor]|uniref:Uncharacterized protein n=1 Tax=Rhamnusium bicolor TaxID=1586634 RepID=A0AAV8X923_9CUCU|nr:hypothetical protein NQ314_012862 [Rhamnusium bicolor]